MTVLTRRSLPPHVDLNPPSKKLTVIHHSDFLSYPASLLEQLEGAVGRIWDLGKFANGFGEKEYEVISKDYAVAAFTIKRDQSQEKVVFAFLSGASTSQIEEKNWLMFGKVKGRAERALAHLQPGVVTYSFRLGGILPVSPVPETSLFQRLVMDKVVLPFLAMTLPQTVIKSDVLGQGMIEAVSRGGSGAIEGWEGKGEPGDGGVFENEEIKRLAKGQSKI
ncbi:hypothetical protein P7C70_g8837, partial [Phenoliferia sp. Uapishka_3]